MGVIIDSNILIDAERDRFDLATYVSNRTDQFYISAVSASEILVGLYYANNPIELKRRTDFTEWLFDRFSILPADLNVAREHAKLVAYLRKNGIVIGNHDSWIAATCLCHQCSIATRNVKEFKRVPNLMIEAWQ